MIDLDRLMLTHRMRSQIVEVRAPAAWGQAPAGGLAPTCLECLDGACHTPRAKRRGEIPSSCTVCRRGVWIR